MVIGVSAGVGKSTFARKLGEKLEIDVYHLDRFFWKAGWKEASIEDFTSSQQEIVKKKQWIIEGNYSNTINIRLDSADTIFYLELPLHTCLYRVVKRWLTNIGKTRPDMAIGCREKLDWKFIKFIVTTYYSRKIKMEKRLKVLSGTKKVIQLKSKKEINEYFHK